MFENILNWKLLSGSHKFPGPDGGTCINEAAIVAAGFKYRAVQNSADCPPCFSRVIAGYAIRLNDTMPNDLRQELLLPFVTRLAGTADSDVKEIERARHIAIQTIKRILPISLRAIWLEDRAQNCESVTDVDAADAAADAAGKAYAAHAAYAVAKAAYAAGKAHAAYAVAKAAADAAKAAYTAADATYAAYAVAKAAYAAGKAADADARRAIFTIAVAILDEAIKLGNQAAPIETALVVSRMEVIKRPALENA
jgi:hypothetical protein